jgi:hypothetical protein
MAGADDGLHRIDFAEKDASTGHLRRRRTERSHSDPGASVPLLLDPARHQNLDGRFEGSFGASGRPEPVHKQRWFRRKDYFTVGWTDPSIMRGAVCLASNSKVMSLEPC